MERMRRMKYTVAIESSVHFRAIEAISMTQNWRLTIQYWLAKLMIKLGKLTHSDYTEDELNDLVSPHLPESFSIAVPAGNGHLTLMEAEVSLPVTSSYIHVQLLSSLLIESMGNPIYRAHIVVILKAQPAYQVSQNTVHLDHVVIDDIYLVKDEYALLKDTQDIMSLFVPKTMQNILTGTMKSAMGLLTAGGSDAALSYLKLYLTGSKQKVLDYHKPQLENLLTDLIENDNFSYLLDESDWQQKLFRQYGKEVVVEDGALRFKF